MPVLVNEAAGDFHLLNATTSYIVRVSEGGLPCLLHFGGALPERPSWSHLYPRPFRSFSNGGGRDARLECPTPCTGDFRVPALDLELADGSRVLELRHRNHRVHAGKPGLQGLPSTYVEDEAEAVSLEIILEDQACGIIVSLSYTIFRDFPAIARSMRVSNRGPAPARLLCAMSASIDLEPEDWELTTLSGAWAAERSVSTRRLAPGLQSVGSLRGASSHQHNPFLALSRPGATETSGEIFGLALVYSGNFLAEVESDVTGLARARIGVSPAGFSWELGPGSSFQTPEAILVHSDAGFGAMSETYHGLFRTRLARGPWRDRARPVLVNNWEGTYWNFTEPRILDIARGAKGLGAELFVLDDGWFGHRDDDRSSLGDWTPHPQKLPDGIGGLARKIEALGLGFGIWIEPEMVSPDSELFRAHPDWAVGVPGRPRTELRNQYVLDLGRPEVVDHVHAAIADVLDSGPVSYVKWDMNRVITESFSLTLPAGRQGEFHHRYILGLYDLYARLTAEFPEVLFESCAGGGGRFDPGILAFAPQGWTSDNSDAVDRLRIQWGTSLVYPLSSMGAHVSVAPNHQNGRVTSLDSRVNVAVFGVFGAELDPGTLDEAERRRLAEAISLYKDWRGLVLEGRFLRLRSPFAGDGNSAAWSCVAQDGSRALVGWYQVLKRVAEATGRLRLRGLDAARDYMVHTWPDRGDLMDKENSGIRSGAELMELGLRLSAEERYGSDRGDFWSRLFTVEAVAAPQGGDEEEVHAKIAMDAAGAEG